MDEKNRERIDRLMDQLAEADDREAVRIRQRIRELKDLELQHVT